MSVINIRVRPELFPYDLQWHRIDKVEPPFNEEVYIWPLERVVINGPPIAIGLNPEFNKESCTHWRKIIGPDDHD